MHRVHSLYLAPLGVQQQLNRTEGHGVAVTLSSMSLLTVSLNNMQDTMQRPVAMLAAKRD